MASTSTGRRASSGARRCTPKLDVETVRKLFNELVEKLTGLEDESHPPQTITIAFHPTIAQGDTD